MKRYLSALTGVLCAAMLLGGVEALADNSAATTAKTETEERRTIRSKGDSALITADQAKEAAWKMVPRSCAYLTTDTERYLYEVKYFDKTNQQKYVVQVGKTKGDILQLTVQSADAKGGASAKISAGEAEQIIRALYSDVLTISAALEQSEGGYVYVVRYQTPFTVGTARVNAETGKILERDDLYFQAKNQELSGVVKNASTAETLARQAVSVDAISESALTAVPGGGIDRIQLTGDKTLYEVKMHKGDYEYELLFNAATGARLNLSTSYDPADLQDDWYQNPGSVQKASPRFGMAQIQSPTAVKTNGSEDAYITRDKAKSIALRSAPAGAKVKSMSLKHDGGKTYYEGWLRLDGYLYGFQIDAVSGSVTNWDTQIDPKWDPDAHHDVDSEKDDDTDYGSLKMDDD